MKFRYRSFGRKAGDVERSTAMWAQQPPHNKGSTVAQKAGIRFERKVFKSLLHDHPQFVEHLPFLYYSNGSRHAAIPDGLVFSRALDLLTIVEVKLRHTNDAWNQLNLLYLPVVQRAFPAFRIKLLEVCRWYDPTVALPCAPLLIDDLKEWFEQDDLRYAIHIWNGD